MEAGVRSRFVMAGRVKTHYIEAGQDGPPLIFCHGGGAGASGDAGFGRMAPLLAPKFTVYALDSVGGYGETDATFPTPEGIQDRVTQLEWFVDTLCLDGLYLTGNSQGAWVAAKYAIQHPEKVKKLFFIASGTIGVAMGINMPETEGMRALRAYDGTPQAMRRLLDNIIYDHSKITDQLVEVRNKAATRPGARETARLFQEGTMRVMRDDPVLRPMKFEMTWTLPHLNLPIKCIWGEEDKFADPQMGRELQKLLPNVVFEFIPKAGHQAQTDQPETVARLMTEFWESDGR